MEITICPEELAKGEMSQIHLDPAVEAIRKEGYVVLENIVSHAHLDILRERMDEDSQKLINAEKWGGAGRIKGHLQQGPPPFAPYVFRDIVANPFVIQVTKTLLGEGVFNSFYNGNTNSPGSGTQPLHRDGGHLWPGLKVAHPTASVVVNIVPMDATEENGSVELWPGSHLDTSVDRRIDEQAEEARRKLSPPVRGNTKKGSVLIRDIRLWHRGVPNPSDRPRHMIAMIHNIHWLRRGKPLKFNKGCEAIFENSGGLDANVEFTDEQIDYLFLKSR
ncbi:phytanoyl-CoA dioxygenase family protein [Candidatus Poribacteria bacterium]|nr:phytanoyl-CoA dioxygenase family protein [Candidatus Poribacteria bacterium]